LFAIDSARRLRASSSAGSSESHSSITSQSTAAMITAHRRGGSVAQAADVEQSTLNAPSIGPLPSSTLRQAESRIEWACSQSTSLRDPEQRRGLRGFLTAIRSSTGLEPNRTIFQVADGIGLLA
jgi:hypothetical protein